MTDTDTSPQSRPRYPRVVAVGLLAALLVVTLGVVGLGAVTADAGAETAASASTSANTSIADPDDDTKDGVSEAEYVEPAPEPGDLYYEASDDDWISYINPRDEYRSPYLGDGSGKICVTLLNEAGDPIVGETVPNTSATVPTGDSLEWHSEADPLTVEFPMTDHYDRPLDSDQFGTTDDLPQGDGYMDSHCIEMHGQPEDATIEYGEAQLEGDHAEDIEVVGYIQQAHDAWDTDIDPIEDAQSYEKAGGWTKHEGGSHGQAVVVLQLEGEVDDTGDASDATGSDATDDNSSDGADNTTEEAITTESSENGDETDGTDDGLPGFGVPVALVALSVLALVGFRQRTR